MRPEDILPDDVNKVNLGGLEVRKGSVAAFLANALRLQQGPDAEAEAHLRALVPALRALRLFEVFELRDPKLRALVERV